MADPPIPTRPIDANTIPMDHFFCEPGKPGLRGVVTIQPDFQITLQDGRVVRFEWHRYLGPTLCGRDGEPLARQPGSRNPFWYAFKRWLAQGRRVQDGKALWDDAPLPEHMESSAEMMARLRAEGRLKHIGGKHYIVENKRG